MKHCSNNASLQHEFIREYLTGLDCPRSLTVWLLFESKEYDQLVNLEFKPHDYNDFHSGRDSLAATKFLSKATFLELDRDLRAVALEGFFAAEENCRKTNHRLFASAISAETQSIMLMASGHIANLLGDFSADEYVDSCNFGPGATTSLTRRDATLPNKYNGHHCITMDAYDFVLPWWRSAYPTWDAIFCLQGHSKIVTVPKNAKTDRTIAIEPSINLWLQKGVGSMIRRRLSRSGLDLSTQTINQQRARLGSLTNHLTTVDFSAASDTISKTVVRELLPPRWFTLMDAVRSKYGLVDTKIVNFEKFSSMGNGFTFELETLIFYSLALSVARYLGLSTSGISVYGDDVILPTRAFDMYVRVCADLGFTTNTAKSYSDSYYRESCGSHFWHGRDIKPIFLKEPLNGKIQMVKFANSVRRYAHSRNHYGCDYRLRRCYELLVTPLQGVARISDGFGDCGLIENIDHPTVRCSRASHGIEGFHVRLWVPIAEMKFHNCRGLLLSKLKAIGSFDGVIRPDQQGIGNDIPLSCRTKHTKVRMLIPRWADLGPWV